MRLSLTTICLAAFAMAAPPVTAQTPSPPAGPINLLTYVEIRPAWGKEAIAALETYRQASRKEAGALSVNFYQEIGCSNRFLIEEVWKEFAAYETHAKSSQLADALKAGLVAPPDLRPHGHWSVVGLRQAPDADCVFALAHVDVHPPYLADLESLLRPYAEKSRGETGARRIDVLQCLLRPAEQMLGEKSKVKDRKNHMTVVEAWASEADFRAHQRSLHAIEFRAKVGPLFGSLYDQRLYRLLK